MCNLLHLCTSSSHFRWNQLDIFIVLLSVVGIFLEEMKSNVIPINPTIIRVMRVLRIARGKTVFYTNLRGGCEKVLSVNE